MINALILRVDASGSYPSTTDVYLNDVLVAVKPGYHDEDDIALEVTEALSSLLKDKLNWPEVEESDEYPYYMRRL